MKLRTLRHEHRLTQLELSERTGVSLGKDGKEYPRGILHSKKSEQTIVAEATTVRDDEQAKAQPDKPWETIVDFEKFARRQISCWRAEQESPVQIDFDYACIIAGRIKDLVGIVAESDNQPQQPENADDRVNLNDINQEFQLAADEDVGECNEETE